MTFNGAKVPAIRSSNCLAHMLLTQSQLYKLRSSRTDKQMAVVKFAAKPRRGLVLEMPEAAATKDGSTT